MDGLFDPIQRVPTYWLALGFLGFCERKWSFVSRPTMTMRCDKGTPFYLLFPKSIPIAHLSDFPYTIHPML
jgi:hypothetical protein